MYEIKKGKPFASVLTNYIYTFNIPKNMEKSEIKWFWRKYILLKLVTIFVAIVEPTLHIAMTFKNKTGIDVSDDIAIVGGYMGCLISCLLFTVKFKKWMDFFNEATFFDDVGDSSIILEKAVKRFNLIFIIGYGSTLFGMASWVITQIVHMPECKRLNQERDLHEVCGTYLSVYWLPFFNTDNLAIIIIISVVQLLLCICLVPTAALLTLILWESTEILIVHISILRECFLHLFDETGEISDKLRFCINYHVRILSMANHLSMLVKYTLSQMAFLSAVAIGFILNQITKTGALYAIPYLICYIGSTFIICHGGEIIKNESLSLGDGIYASNWHRADPKTMRDLAFIISRCQKPMCLESLPLGVLEYPLFVMILKTSYSYLTLLNQTM